MTVHDDTDRRPTPLPELDDFEAWLEHRVETTGTDRGAVLDDLVAAYWALDEIFGIVEGLDAEPSTPRAHQRSSTEERGEPATRVEEQARVEEEARLEALETGLDDLSDRLAELDATAETPSSESADAAETRALGDHVEGLQRELAALQTEMAERADATTAYVEGEFRHLRPVLEYLLDELSSLDQRDDDLEASVDTLGTRLTNHLGDHEALLDLKRSANRQGVEHAECDHCDSRVAIALLAAPACPACGVVLTGVETRPRRFRRPRAVLTTDGDADRAELTWSERSIRN